jgi:hypothetical protein
MESDMRVIKERRARATQGYAYGVGQRAKQLLKLHKHTLSKTMVLNLELLAHDPYNTLKSNRDIEDIVNTLEQKDLRKTKFTIELMIDLSKDTGEMLAIMKKIIQEEAKTLRAHCHLLAKQDPLITASMRTYVEDDDYEDTEEEDIYPESNGEQTK